MTKSKKLATWHLGKLCNCNPEIVHQATCPMAKDKSMVMCTCGSLSSESRKKIDDLWRKEGWLYVFRTIYDNNENGGSSRWLVTPLVVESFIQGLLVSVKKVIQSFGNMK